MCVCVCVRVGVYVCMWCVCGCGCVGVSHYIYILVSVYMNLLYQCSLDFHTQFQQRHYNIYTHYLGSDQMCNRLCLICSTTTAKTLDVALEWYVVCSDDNTSICMTCI